MLNSEGAGRFEFPDTPNDVHGLGIGMQVRRSASPRSGLGAACAASMTFSIAARKSACRRRRSDGLGSGATFPARSKVSSQESAALLASAWAFGVSISKTADHRKERGQDKNENHEANKSVHIPNGTQHVRYSPSYADILLS
jgi:hypothetical protein